MIHVTRLHGSQAYSSAEHLQAMESTPVTLVQLTNGQANVRRDSAVVVGMRLMIDCQKRIRGIIWPPGAAVGRCQWTRSSMAWATAPPHCSATERADMSEERTEAATRQRRAAFRTRGQTSRSHDLTTASVLLAGLSGLNRLAGSLHD